MKYKSKALAAAVILASGLGATAAYADTITFNGAIIDSPCSIKANQADQTIEMGQISNRVLAQNGNTGKSTPEPFSIELTDCQLTDEGGATNKSVSVTFTGTADATNADALALAGTASGASLVIGDQAQQVINLGQASPAISLADGTNKLNFTAWLQGNGAGATIVPGNFSTVANFTLAYQ